MGRAGSGKYINATQLVSNQALSSSIFEKISRSAEGAVSEVLTVDQATMVLRESVAAKRDELLNDIKSGAAATKSAEKKAETKKATKETLVKMTKVDNILLFELHGVRNIPSVKRNNIVITEN